MKGDKRACVCGYCVHETFGAHTHTQACVICIDTACLKIPYWRHIASRLCKPPQTRADSRVGLRNGLLKEAFVRLRAHACTQLLVAKASLCGFYSDAARMTVDALTAGPFLY